MAIDTNPAAMSARHLMLETLEAGLSRLRGRPVRVREVRPQFVQSRPLPRTARLRITLDDGEPLRVFLKTLGESGLRELRMYQSVLSPERFGTLRLYGFRWEPDRGRCWMFLEECGRVVLQNVGELPPWTAAARWAARFHAATRDSPDPLAAFLPSYDETHYRRRAAQVRGIMRDLAGRERDLIGRALERHDAAVPWLAGLPQCVVHGEYEGENILLRRGPNGLRIVVIDWETAALGPGVTDLVSLTSGASPAAQREAMCVAYLDEYQAVAGSSLDPYAFREQIAQLTVYHALDRLAWWGQHGSLSRPFARVLRELERALEG